MSALSRRNFISAGGAAAAGAVVLVGPLSHASAAGPGASPEQLEEFVPEGAGHMVIYVKNASSGEVAVMTEGHEVVFTDKVLVARVQRAAARATKVGAK